MLRRNFMKFTCQKEAVLKEIAIAYEIASSRNFSSFMSSVYIQAVDNILIIKATDSNFSYETSLEVDVLEEGSAVVYCDKLLTVLRSCPDEELLFESIHTDFNVTLKNNDSLFYTLKMTVSDAFPEIGMDENVVSFSFSQKEFLKMINHTLFSVSNDENRIYLTGVLFCKKNSSLRMVSTDMKQMSIIDSSEIEVPDFKDIIIPKKALTLFKRLTDNDGNFDIMIGDKKIVFKFGNTYLYSFIINNSYPDYERIIPKDDDKSIVVNKNELISVINRISVMIENKTNRINLRITNNEMSVETDKENTFGKAFGKIPCVYTGGDNVTISLNYMFLLDPLKIIDSENIEIRFSHPEKAVTIYSVPQEKFLHIVMPMTASQ